MVPNLWLHVSSQHICPLWSSASLSTLRFIYTVACSWIAFISCPAWCSSKCTYHNFFICSRLDGHGGCCQFGAIPRGTTLHLLAHDSVDVCRRVCWGSTLRMDLLSDRDVVRSLHTKGLEDGFSHKCHLRVRSSHIFADTGVFLCIIVTIPCVCSGMALWH